MSGELLAILSPFGVSFGNPSSTNANRVDTMPTNTNLINTTTMTNGAQSVVDENLPQLLDSRGGSHVTNVLAFDKENFISWNVRFLVFLDGLEPYLLKTLEDGPFVTMSKDEETTKNKEFMAIVKDEPFVGKADARFGQWVDITMKKSPEFTTCDDPLANHEPDHAESADILKSDELQDNVLSESSYDDQPTPIISPSAYVILQNHMEMKSAFLNGKISKKVYVEKPPSSERSEFRNYVFKLNKALYGLKQAPRAWYQANPKESYLVVVKRIFRYLKGIPNSGLCNQKGSCFDLEAYSDSEYAGCNLDRKAVTTYSASADDIAIETITFLLSWKDKPLSFTQDEFISAIGLHIYKDTIPIPPKEIVRARLATLGLFDKEKPNLSSIVLVNSSPLKIKYFLPI
nr:retrovirus-related Pol polyprotein from transposon TNT 1-94 [Tanacetum cinerariifolium]